MKAAGAVLTALILILAIVGAMTTVFFAGITSLSAIAAAPLAVLGIFGHAFGLIFITWMLIAANCPKK